MPADQEDETKGLVAMLGGGCARVRVSQRERDERQRTGCLPRRSRDENRLSVDGVQFKKKTKTGVAARSKAKEEAR